MYLGHARAHDKPVRVTLYFGYSVRVSAILGKPDNTLDSDLISRGPKTRELFFDSTDTL